MKYLRILSIFSLLFLMGCEKVQKIENIKVSAERKSVEELTKDTISKYLSEDLWIERDIYDAGHYLMVPLHFAFSKEDNELIGQFESQVTRFLDKDNINVAKDKNKLNNLQYYYVLSRYLVLSNQNSSYDFNESTNEKLNKKLVSEVEKLWVNTPAWQWGMDDFNSMKDRILWKINNQTTEKSYYRAIIDEELYTFAIAADLSVLNPDNAVLNEIKTYAYKVFKQESTFYVDESWIFQKGIWDDHPDYAYVGYNSKENVGDKKPLSGTVTDSSHSHRFPLWINSFISSFEKGTDENKFFITVLDGLEKQFYENVLVQPNNSTPYFRLTNFMDGYNGLYRWNYSTTNSNDGYGPYELSGTFVLGWWAFLGSERIKLTYKNLYNQYPLSDEAIRLYIGPNTNRERNPLVKLPDAFTNGFNELLAFYASEI